MSETNEHAEALRALAGYFSRTHPASAATCGYAAAELERLAARVRDLELCENRMREIAKEEVFSWACENLNL